MSEETRKKPEPRQETKPLPNPTNEQEAYETLEILSNNSKLQEKN